MEDVEFHDSRNEKYWKQLAAAKQKKGKKSSKKVVEAQRLKWRTEKQNQKTKKPPELAENLNSASEFSIWVTGLR